MTLTGIFYVDVGQLPAPKAAEAIKSFKESVEKQNSKEFNIIAIYVPVRDQETYFQTIE